MKADRQLAAALPEYKKIGPKDEEVYIQATLEQARQGLYRIGKAKGTATRRSPGARRTGGLAVLKVTKTCDADALEKRILHTLQHLRDDNNQGFFRVPYNMLKRIVDVTARTFEADIETANHLTDEVNGLRKHPQGVDWMDGLPPGTFGPALTGEWVHDED